MRIIVIKYLNLMYFYIKCVSYLSLFRFRFVKSDLHEFGYN